MEFSFKYFLIIPVALFSLTTAFIIYTKTSEKKVADTADQTQDAFLKTGSIKDEEVKKSKFSFEVVKSPSPLPSAIFSSPSPSLTSLPSTPSPSLAPSPSVVPSPLPSPSPSPSPLPSALVIPVEEIGAVPDDQFPDLPYYSTFSEGGFAISFKYHPEWVASSNNSLDKLHFLNTSKTALLQGKIFYAFEDPDYQLGKYEIMQVNMFNPDGRSLLDWLLAVNTNASSNPAKLVYQKINGKQFLRVKDKENQVYYLGPGGKIYSFWFKCADWENCSSSNEALFRKILETVN